MPTTTANPITSVLLSGKFSARKASGAISPDELRALHRAGPAEIHELLDLFYAYEFTPFAVDPKIPASFAPPAGAPFEAGGPSSLANFGWMTAVPHSVPATCSNRRVVFNNRAESWGDRGPLWGIRGYNVMGVLENLEMWRCGDWTQGREGHAVYLNVAGSLTVRKLKAVQCGGQLLQLVWRASETRMLEALWPDANDTILLEECEAVDCGAINEGMAVRASWPVSIFHPGQRIAVRDLVVETNLPTFVGGTAGPCNSHGALVATWGERGVKTPELVIDGLHGRLVKPDRSVIRLTGVGHTELRRIGLTVEGGAMNVALVEDCDSLIVEDCTVPVRVDFAAADKPWTTTRSHMVPAGERFQWGLP